MRIVPALALVGMFAAILTFSTRVTWADPSIQDFAKLCRNDPIIQESNILPLIEDGLKKHPESFPNVSSREILAIAVKEHVQKCTVRMMDDASIFPAMNSMLMESADYAWDALNTECFKAKAPIGPCITAQVLAAQNIQAFSTKDDPPGAKDIVRLCSSSSDGYTSVDWEACIEMVKSRHPPVTDISLNRCAGEHMKDGASGEEAASEVVACLLKNRPHPGKLKVCWTKDAERDHDIELPLGLIFNDFGPVGGDVGRDTINIYILSTEKATIRKDTDCATVSAELTADTYSGQDDHPVESLTPGENRLLGPVGVLAKGGSQVPLPDDLQMMQPDAFVAVPFGGPAQ